MSDKNPVLTEAFGVPLTWIFSPSGDILRDFDEVPISKYLVEFDYEYDEEGDDTCTLKFKFESLRSFDLPYFQQDVILMVQWGYLTGSGTFIKSPTRKIAIRDLETNYKADCIELELKCTDLISYLKNYQTRTVRHYQQTGDSNSTISAVNQSEDNFIDWLGEIGKNNFNATITKNKQALRIDKFGEQKAASYDPKTGAYSSAVDNVRVRKDLTSQFKASKVIKGKSMALTHAIQSQLKLMNDQEAAMNGGGGGGPFIQDSTDDTLEIKQRNFHQNIFKTYTYYGGSGELLSFKSNTNTRKEKKDISVSSGVNPYSKKIESTTMVSADTKTKGVIPDFKKPEDMTEAEKNEATEKLKKSLKEQSTVNTKPNEETLKQYYADARKVFKYNIDNPLKQKELPSLRYSYTKYGGDSYMGQGGKKEVQVVIPAQVVLNMPEFRALSKKSGNSIRAQFHRESVLTGYTVEKIQRKYEADMEVIGDPSLIKGKIIYINNLGRLDRGKWYIISCKHKISMEQGYTCEMNVMRNPSTVGLSMKRYASNPKFDRKNNKLEFEKTDEDIEMELYKEPKDENNKTVKDMDSDYESKFREENEVSMNKRLDDLKAEEDFRLGKEKQTTEPIPKEDYEQLRKPNNDKF